MDQFTAIIVTAAGYKQAAAYQLELEARQKNGLITPNTFVLAVPDPSSARVGSGGATFNAIVAATEHLCARSGYASVTPDILAGTKVVIIHSGGDSRRSPFQAVCGKAWSLVNSDSMDSLVTPFDLLLQNIASAFKDSPPGLIVASSDVLLDFGTDCKMDWSRKGVTGLGIPMDIEYGTRHGVFIHGPDMCVKEFCQKATVSQLREKGAVIQTTVNGVMKEKVVLDSGVVFFDAETTQILTNIHLYPPLDACTYMGVDNGTAPLRIELYSDIMEALGNSPLTYEQFLDLPTASKNLAAVREARVLFWKHLRPIQFHVAVPSNSDFVHVGTTLENVEFLSKPSTWTDRLSLKPHVHSCTPKPEMVEGAVVMNSLIEGDGVVGAHAIIENCMLKGKWTIGSHAFVSQVRDFDQIKINDRIAVQQVVLSESSLLNLGEDTRSSASTPVDPNPPQYMSLLVYCIDDNVKGVITDKGTKFCNTLWSRFLEIADVPLTKIWPNTPDEERTMWNAKLFPLMTQGTSADVALWMQDPENADPASIRQWRECERIAFSDLLNLCDPLDFFRWRRLLHTKICIKQILNVLSNGIETCLLGLIKLIVNGGEMIKEAIEELDNLAYNSPPTRLPRILSTIADFLAELSMNRGGLRSGPARNPDWDHAMSFIRQKNFNQAIKSMAELREHWLNSPERMIRAARHYEAAAQVIVSENIKKCSLPFRRVQAPPTGTWVHCSCPIRIDLAGGWTDTPPITYELEGGGVCVNVAVSLEGQDPVYASARRLDSPSLVMQPPEDKESPTLIWTSMDDIRDYHQPLAPGALFKCAVIALGLVDPMSSRSLYDQLNYNVGGGIEIRMKSTLPQGSGLGTSSVLSAALLAAICTAVGLEYNNDSIVHAVLILEQLLTTGGGWQDQVGGLLPGFKYTVSPDRLPVSVQIETLTPPKEFIQAFNDRVVCIYTGRQRLARSLLQDVIRHWYAREPSILDAVRSLRDNSYVCRNAILAGDIEQVGVCLSKYWAAKRVMAPQSEPKFVVDIREAVADLIYGSELTGAGGGGFFVCITKEPNQLEVIKARLANLPSAKDMLFMRANVHEEGLTVRIGDE